jgi:hypothetical protein
MKHIGIVRADKFQPLFNVNGFAHFSGSEFCSDCFGWKLSALPPPKAGMRSEMLFRQKARWAPLLAPI